MKGIHENNIMNTKTFTDLFYFKNITGNIIIRFPILCVSVVIFAKFQELSDFVSTSRIRENAYNVEGLLGGRGLHVRSKLYRI